MAIFTGFTLGFEKFTVFSGGKPLHGATSPRPSIPNGLRYRNEKFSVSTTDI